MECHNDSRKCMRRPKCEHACDLRVQFKASQAVDDEAQCREAYENTFHKIKATMGYDQWRLAYEAGRRAEAPIGFNAGWQACTQAWAEHMRGMARALKP